MIFLAVIDLPRPVPDRCEACHERATAILFTLSGPHEVGRDGRDRGRERYPGGPDVFLLCRAHAAAAHALIHAEDHLTRDQVRRTSGSVMAYGKQR